MHHFQVKKGELYAENVPLSKLAATYGTPLYVYSASTITDHFDRLTAALSPLDHLICFAIKANSNLAVLNLLAKRGSGFDLVSGGELTRVRKAGGDPRKCSFAGVGKTRAEIEQALAANVYVFNVESIAELDFINQVAGEKRKRAGISIRVNPNVDAATHSKITTGTYENKFGIAFEEIGALYARAARMKNLKMLGVHMHIGSQITEAKPFVQAVKKMLPLVKDLKARHGIEFFDIGGGLGIVYDPALPGGELSWGKNRPKPPLTPATYGKQIVPLLKPLGLRILVEPGRFLVGNAGVLVTEVLYVKKTGRKTFVVVDAAMNDLIRPAFYEAYHEIVPLKARRGGKLVPTDLVGPICESGDVFTHDRPLPAQKSGDRLALMSAGAYGFVMASNYNTRPRVAEVLVKGSTHRVVRKRETVADLMKGETI